MNEREDAGARHEIGITEEEMKIVRPHRRDE
jgi:hypothetical protein